MATSSVTSKGQITLPISVRKKLRLNSGDLVEFVEREDGEFTVKAKKGDLMEFYGFMKRTGKPLTIKEMDDSIAAHLGEDDARIKREYAAHQKRSGK
jgi:AbrB family looped-hinge helix DNA binding protein